MCMQSEMHGMVSRNFKPSPWVSRKLVARRCRATVLARAVPVVYVRVYVRCFFFLFLGNEEIDEVSIDDLYVLHGGMHWAGKSPDLRVKSTTTDDDGLANNEKN